MHTLHFSPGGTFRTPVGVVYATRLGIPLSFHVTPTPMAVFIRTSPAGGAAAPDRLRRRLRTAPGCKLAYARRCVRLFRSQPSPPSFSTGILAGKQPPLSPCAASRSCQLNLTRAHFLQAPLGMVVVPLRPRRLGHVRALSGEALRDAGLEAASRRAVLCLVVQQLVSSFASPAGMVHGPLIVDQVY